MKNLALIVLTTAIMLPQSVLAEEYLLQGDEEVVSNTDAYELQTEIIEEPYSEAHGDGEPMEDYVEITADADTGSLLLEGDEFFFDATDEEVLIGECTENNSEDIVSAGLMKDDNETAIIDIDYDDNTDAEEVISIDAVHFPDGAFRTYIGEHFDTNQDGTLSPEEIQKIIWINVDNMGIHSLNGIEYFSNLGILECSNNYITSIDLTKNPGMSRIFIDNNLLEHFIVNENNRHLGIVHCSNNRLTELDLSKSPIQELICSSNELVSLKVNPTRLDASNNHLVCFDITGMDVTTAWTGTSSLDHWYNLENNYHYIPREFDLAELYSYGFDLNKVSDWFGGSLDGSVLTMTGNTARYRYKIGKDAFGDDRYEIFTFVTDGYTLHNDPDGKWRVYSGDSFVDDYNGLLAYGGGEFFITNGILCSEANGLNLYEGKWYFLSQGQVQRQWTGFAEYDNHWFYIRDGVLDESANGLYYYDGEYFLLAAGKVLDQYNGLWQNTFPSTSYGSIAEEGEWYFLANGQVQRYFSGVAMYDGAFFVVTNGRFENDYNGEIDYDNHKFTVVNGELSKYPIR